MIQRDIKFKVWIPYSKTMMTPKSIQEMHESVLGGVTIGQMKQWVYLQYTGLKDKIGEDIYPCDLLRIKGQMGDDAGYYYDAIYAVNQINHEGGSLYFVRLFSLLPDAIDNSYPISTSPSFRSNSLCVDYRKEQYGRLAMNETTGENRVMRSCWKENHYSNDIKIIGNIYQNPELINHQL